MYEITGVLPKGSSQDINLPVTSPLGWFIENLAITLEVAGIEVAYTSRTPFPSNGPRPPLGCHAPCLSSLALRRPCRSAAVQPRSANAPIRQFVSRCTMELAWRSHSRVALCTAPVARCVACAETAEVVVRQESAPLHEILKHMLHASDNLYAECVLRSMGLRRGIAQPQAAATYALERLADYGLDAAWLMWDGALCVRFVDTVAARALAQSFAAVALARRAHTPRGGDGRPPHPQCAPVHLSRGASPPSKRRHMPRPFH
jgi:hypothetical protein